MHSRKNEGMMSERVGEGEGVGLQVSFLASRSLCFLVVIW